MIKFVSLMLCCISIFACDSNVPVNVSQDVDSSVRTGITVTEQVVIACLPDAGIEDASNEHD